MAIMIGTPMYGGGCTSEYTESILNLSNTLHDYGIKMYPGFLSNESLIQRGRNTIAWHFLNTDATHLLFIDADQSFRPNDILKMISSGKDFIGGPVPLKGINWENVRKAALAGEKNLADYTGHYNINHLDGVRMTDENTPFEVEHVGAAFTLLSRKVFEDLIPHTPTYINGGTSIPNNVKVYDFFRVEVDPKKQHLLSEDYFFCHSYRNIGGKVWCAPWCKVGHAGYYVFEGRYAATNKG